jgi:hypothetical protein
MGYRFNPPPNWPAPPPGWVPPPIWRPSPEWPAPPPGWQLWIDDMAPAQGQPPWGASHPSAGNPPMSQQGGPASGYRASQMPPPPPSRARRKPPRKRNVILLAIATFFLIGVIADALGGGNHTNMAVNAPIATATASHPESSASPNTTTKAEAACGKRGFTSGDIYVRMLSPGIQWTAQELGGEWTWNAVLNKCMTSVQLMIATAPLSSGNCTQVGYKADNPGYDPNATVAAPLRRVAAQAGPACPTATQSTPVRTTPAAAVPTPVKTTPAAAPVTTASSAPAGCYPLTNSGNCYEPGEYCRNADHGMSGVAGDGEPITCEDNDGWRWEPS